MLREYEYLMAVDTSDPKSSEYINLRQACISRLTEALGNPSSFIAYEVDSKFCELLEEGNFKNLQDLGRVLEQSIPAMEANIREDLAKAAREKRIASL
jgi:hypothetical protein